MGLLKGFQLGVKLASAGFEHPTFRIGEAGEVRREKFRKRSDHRLKACFDLLGGQGKGGSVRILLCGKTAARIYEKRLAGGRVGGAAIGGKKRLSFREAKSVAADGGGQGHLLLLAEGAELHGHRDRERADVEPPAEFGGQTPGELEPAGHPSFLSAQELGDGRRGKPVVVDQRGHDARLVHGPERSQGGVGLKEPLFSQDPLGGFDDDGHFGSPFFSPQGQALEAVENLEGFVGVLGDAKRQHRKGAVPIGSFAAKRLKIRSQRRDGDQAHERHGLSSKGKIW